MNIWPGRGICRALGLASGGLFALSQRISGEVLTQFLFYLDMVLRGWGLGAMWNDVVFMFFCGMIDEILKPDCLRNGNIFSGDFWVRLE